MSFSPTLDTAVSRVRLGVGDIAIPELFGDAIYEALLLAAANDEAAATKSAAAALAAYYANQPSSLTADGSSFSWAERIKQWNAIALGTAGSTVPTAAPSTSSPTPASSAAVATCVTW